MHTSKHDHLPDLARFLFHQFFVLVNKVCNPLFLAEGKVENFEFSFAAENDLFIFLSPSTIYFRFSNNNKKEFGCPLTYAGRPKPRGVRIERWGEAGKMVMANSPCPKPHECKSPSIQRLSLTGVNQFSL